MLELDKVSKSYGDKLALAEFSAHCQQGQCTVLIGPSGCGKSTVLRLIAGLLKPDSGSIAFDGMPLTAADMTAYRHRIGYVIQDGGLFPHLTAYDNATLLAGYLGWPRVRIAQRIQQLAELVQLPQPLLDHYPDELSGGQRQRVGLMRALMLDPELLLLDEPLGALDPIIRSQLQKELRDIFARLNKVVIMVTHDLAEAAYLGNRLLLMRDGRVLQRGSYRDLLRNPADQFVEQFISAQRDPLRQLADPS